MQSALNHSRCSLIAWTGLGVERCSGAVVGSVAINLWFLASRRGLEEGRRRYDLVHIQQHT